MPTADEHAPADTIDQLLNLLLYAPIGLMAKGAESFPDLVDRGRAQAANARVIGQFALGATNAKARTSLEDAERHIAAFFRIVAEAASPTRSTSGPTESPAPVVTDRPTVDDVIGGYDGLTAAQILPLLVDLDADQLAVVETHERTTRARKTVLNRLRQLQR